jgi:hypothetical protein
MIFDCRHIVWCCSQYFVMEPGDVIIAGTLPGVRLGLKPPTFLKAGDVVTLGIDGLGEQRQKVVRGSDDQASADTANAVTTGAGPGGAQPGDDGIAHIRHRPSHLHASTQLHRENGAGHLGIAGAGAAGWCHRCVWD